MKLAVINEVSASSRNKDIINALCEYDELEIYNIGMKDPKEAVPITYIHTGIMAAILLNTNVCDMVVGGCGTGQGFMNAVMQFPKVFCGLVLEPLDAWLFSQINNGNCISLALNKGYGWAANINLQYIFEKLFKDPAGQGYPLERQESQRKSRDILNQLTLATHRDMICILDEIDVNILEIIASREEFMNLLEINQKGNDLVIKILGILKKHKSLKG